MKVLGKIDNKWVSTLIDEKFKKDEIISPIRILFKAGKIRE